MLIPPFNVYPGLDDDLRPDGEPECAYTGAYTDLDGAAWDMTFDKFIDFPKVLNTYLQHAPALQEYSSQGMRITCNRGIDCSLGPWSDLDGDGVCSCQERGGLADTDGDGFCDIEDYSRLC